LADYHLNQRYLAPGEGIVLLPHFQRRIVPNWFDRSLQGRRPSSAALAPVLQVFPAPEFVASLPGGRIPTRDDFVRLVDRPEERIARWYESAARSTVLGEQLLDDVGRGRIPDLVEEM
ncbi:MAG: patatin-like phospholipase family protein, partial [Gemmatimonadota bacterium]